MAFVEKNRFFIALMAVAVLFVAFTVPFSAASARAEGATWDGSASASLSGSGTSSDPYLISSPADFAYIAENIETNSGFEGVYFEMTDDVDFDGRFVIIGKLDDNAEPMILTPFKGIFDGGDFTVYGYVADPSSISNTVYCGLFGYLGIGGKVKNLNATIAVNSEDADTESLVFGGIVGYNEGTVSDCRVGIASDGVESIGGIVGVNGTGGEVLSCTVNAIDMSGFVNAGGIAVNNYGSIEGCSVALDTGDVSLSGNMFGGIAYGNEKDSSGGTISECGFICKDKLDGVDVLGGICVNNGGTVSVCYAEASAEVERFGGICINNGKSISEITYSAFNGSASATLIAGGIALENSGKVEYVSVIGGKLAAPTAGEFFPQTSTVKYAVASISVESESEVNLSEQSEKVFFDEAVCPYGRDVDTFGIAAAEDIVGLTSSFVLTNGSLPKISELSVFDEYAAAVNEVEGVSVTLNEEVFFLRNGLEMILQAVEKPGYDFEWQDGGGNPYSGVCTFDEDIKLTAEYSLKKIIVGDLEGITKAYDGNTETLTAPFTHELTLTYLWKYKASEKAEYEECGTDEQISIKDVADSGWYYCKASYSDGENSVSETSEEIYVSVIPGHYPENSHTHAPIDGGTYAGKTLSYYNDLLDDGFYWTNPDIVPAASAEGISYGAYYNDSDGNMENLYVGIVLTLAFAEYDSIEYDYGAATAISAGVYTGANLGTVSLNSGFYWEATESVKVLEIGTFEYEAYYQDNPNYKKYGLTIRVKVDPIPSVVNPVVGSEIAGYAGTVYYVNIGDAAMPSITTMVSDTPGEIAWVSPTVSSGTNQYQWQFTPDNEYCSQETGYIEISFVKKALLSIKCGSSPYKTEYVVNEPFDPAGMSVIAVFNSGEEYVTGYTFAYKEADRMYLKVEDEAVQIIYWYNSTKKTFDLPITVHGKAVVSLEIEKLPTKMSYIAFDEFDPTGMKVNAIYNTGKETIADYSVLTYIYNGERSTFEVGDTELTVSYTYLDTTVTATVSDISVGQKAIAVPSDGNIYRYADGEGLVSLLAETALYSVSCEEQTDVGSHVAYVELKDDINYRWEGVEGKTAEVNWVIGPKPIPTPDTDSPVFNGERKNCGVVSCKYYSVSGTPEAIIAGPYEIELALTDPARYNWAEGGAANKKLTWNIGKRTVKAPIKDETKTYVYSGNFIRFSYTVYEGSSEDIKGGTDAGDYTVRVVLADMNNYEWETGGNEEKKLTFTIDKKEVNDPEINTETKYTYSGLYIRFDFTVDEGTKVNIDGGTDAKDYVVKFSVSNKDNYKWATAGEDVRTHTFTIDKKRINEPTVVQVFDYDGSESEKRAYSGQNSDIEVVTDVANKITDRATEAGEYTLRLKLVDSDNCCWNDDKGTIDPKDFAWRINRKFVEKPINGRDFVYNGEKQTADIPAGNYYFLTGDREGVNYGSYTVVAVLINGNYRWVNPDTDEDDTKPVEIVWHIEQKPMALPDDVKSDYTGKPQRILADIEELAVSGNEKTDVDIYEVTVALIDDNYCWEDGNANTERTIYWTISPYEVTEPVVSGYSVYTGKAQTAPISVSQYYELSNNTVQTDVGEYSVVAKLNDKKNYVWKKTGNNADIEGLLWIINPAEVDIPVVSDDLIYNGETQSVKATVSDYYTVTGSGKDAGEYTAVATLRDSKNYIWKGGDNKPVSLTFHIYKLSFVEEGEAVNISYEAGMELPIPQKEGFNFAGWYLTPDFDSEKVTSISSLDKDTMLYAKWEKSSIIEKQDSPAKSDKKLSTMAIIGISVMGVCLLVAVAIVVLAVVGKHKKLETRE